MSFGGATGAPMSAFQYDLNILPIGQLLSLKHLESYGPFLPLQAPETFNLEGSWSRSRRPTCVIRETVSETYPCARRSRRSARGPFLRLSGHHGPVANAQQRQVARETRMPNLNFHPALLGAALVFFLFRGNDEEEKLLAQYHTEDTFPNNSGECTADHIAS
jgi:hypothetical protein